MSTTTTIRVAQPSDYDAMASLAADAFIDDDVFGRFMHPRRREYWEDYIGSWRRRIDAMVEEGSGEGLVVAEDADGVAGWACWGWMDLRSVKEDGNGNVNVIGKKTEDGKAATITVTQLPSPPSPPIDRSSSPTNIASFEAAKPLTDHLWQGPRAKTHNLEILCIAPTAQGKGFGAALVRWGLEKAKQENVPASVIAAHEKDTWYARHGFVEMGRADVGPLQGKVLGGTVMFTA